MPASGGPANRRIGQVRIVNWTDRWGNRGDAADCQLHPAATTARRWTVSHLHPDQVRHPPAAIPGRSTPLNHPRSPCGPVGAVRDRAVGMTISGCPRRLLQGRRRLSRPERLAASLGPAVAGTARSTCARSAQAERGCRTGRAPASLSRARSATTSTAISSGVGFPRTTRRNGSRAGRSAFPEGMTNAGSDIEILTFRC